MDTPSTAIGPGIGAFIAFFLLALALWLLMRNMNGRMRRMAYREQERAAEAESRDGGADPAATDAPPQGRRPEGPAQDAERPDPAP